MSDQALLPTDESFATLVGEPAFSMELPLSDENLRIPTGLLACCRVVHQPGCAHYIAESMTGVVFWLKDPESGTKVPSGSAIRFETPGDLLADPEFLLAVVRVLVSSVGHRATSLGAVVDRLWVHTWSFSAEMAEQWRYLKDQGQAELAASRPEGDGLSDEQLRALPVKLFDSNDPDEAGRVLGDLTWEPVEAYIERVAVVPGELGRTSAARWMVDTTFYTPALLEQAS